MAESDAYPPPPFGNLYDFTNPQTTAILGALQGLGTAAQTSLTPVSTGSVFGHLAGGLLSGAETGAKLRGLTAAGVGQNIQNQNALNQLNYDQQYLYGQQPTTPADLLAGHLRQLMLQQPNLPTPAFGSMGGQSNAAPQLVPQTDSSSTDQPVTSPAQLGTDPGQKASKSGQQFSLDDVRKLTARYEGGNKPFVGYGGADLSKAPIDQTGAPIWEGKEGPQGISHAFGLYGFQPGTWATYAPMLGIKDWREPGAQDAVFNLAYLNEGARPWQDNTKLIAALSGRQGAPQQGAQVAAQQSPPNTEAQLTMQGQPGGATPSASQIGVPGSIGGAGVTGNTGTLAGILANPALRQSLALNHFHPGFVPPSALALQFAQALPPGSQQRATYALAAAKELGIPATKGGERPNSPFSYLDVEKFIQTGRPEYVVNEPPGYNKAVYNRALAEVTARGTIEEQKFIDPNTGAGYATNRTALQSGNPLPISLAPGDVETQRKQAEANVQLGLRLGQNLTPAARAYRDYFNQSRGGQVGGVTPPPFGAPGGLTTPPPVAAPGVATPAPFGIGGPPAAPNVTPAAPPGSGVAANAPAPSASGVPSSAGLSTGQIGQSSGTPSGTESGTPQAIPFATRPAAPGLIRFGVDPASNKPVYPNIPDPSLETKLPSPKDYDVAIPKWQKAQEEYPELIDTATKAIERFQTQASVYQSIQSGAWQTEKADLASRLNALGIPVSQKLLNNASAIEIALHENNQATLDTLKGANKKFTQGEFFSTSKNNPNPNLQPATNAQLLAEQIAYLRRDVGLAQGWEVAARQGWRNTNSYETQYFNANPIAPIINATAHELGTFKGQQPVPGGGAPFSPGGPSERQGATTSSTSRATRNVQGGPKEGDIATGPGGHQIKVINGGWVDLTTGQPFDFAKIPSR